MLPKNAGRSRAATDAAILPTMERAVIIVLETGRPRAEVRSNKSGRGALVSADEARALAAELLAAAEELDPRDPWPLIAKLLEGRPELAKRLREGLEASR